jgi:hypothetical protein
MSKQTIDGQQKLIDKEKQIINNIICHHKGHKMPEYEKLYIRDIQKKISERQKWIEQQLGERGNEWKAKGYTANIQFKKQTEPQ